MKIFDLVLGLVWLGLGLFYILGRDRISARQVRRLGRAGRPPMLWIVFGLIYMLIGVVWLVSAFL